MNKSELVETIARKANISKMQADVFLNSFIETIIEEVKNGEKVAISGLGNFERVERSERMGINPATGQKIKIAAKNTPKFKAAKAFKEAIA